MTSEKKKKQIFHPDSILHTSWTLGNIRFLWMTLHCMVTMTFINLNWDSFLTFLSLFCSVCQSNPQGPVCLHGTVVFPWRGPVACQALWEYAEDKDTRGLHWQVGHRYRGRKRLCHIIVQRISLAATSLFEHRVHFRTAIILKCAHEILQWLICTNFNNAR